MAYTTYKPQSVNPAAQGIQQPQQPQQQYAAAPATGYALPVQQAQNTAPVMTPAAPQYSAPAPAAPQYAAPAPAAPGTPPAYAAPAAPQTPQYAEQQKGEYVDFKNGNVFGKDVVLDVKMSLYAPNREKPGEVVNSDFSRAKWSATNFAGGNSVAVTANTDISVALEVFACALRNAHRKTAAPTAPAGVLSVSADALNALQGAITNMAAAFTSFSYENMANAYSGLSTAYNALNPTPAAAGSDDYSFSEGKIDGRKVGQDGFAPTTFVRIERTGMRGNEPARYPWKVSLEVCECRLVRDAKSGKQTFDGKSARNKKSVSVNSSDGDMVAMLFRSMLYVMSFANGISTPVIAEAVNALAAQR